MKVLYLVLLAGTILLATAVLGWMKKGIYSPKAVWIVRIVIPVLLLPEGLIWWSCSAIYKEVFLLLLVCCQLFLLFFERSMAGRRRGEEEQRHRSGLLRFAVKALLIVMICETTIFNFPAFHLWIGDYKERELALADAQISGDGLWSYDEETDRLFIENGEEVILEFPQIGQQVGTLSAEVSFGDEAFVVNMIADASDETHEAYRYDIIKQKIYNFEPDSGIALCHLSGDVGKMRIKFTGEQEQAGYSVSNIRINTPVAFDVSLLRVAMLWGLSVLVYALLYCTAFSKRMKEQEELYEQLSYGVFFAASMLACILIFSKISTDEGVLKVFFQTSGDQMTQELVDAFEAGSVSLLAQPDEELLKLSNPYDRELRDESDSKEKWDHVLFNGKYYSYYGIAPVVLLFLPFHLLTGSYFSTPIAVLLFSITGLWFLIRLYSTVIKKWFEDLPMGLVFCGELVMVSACGIWYALSRPKFYEIAVSAAFMFLTMGSYLLLSSNICGQGRISLKRLTASSLFLALSVLSRPTMAVYCVCACLFYLFGFRKWRKAGQGRAVCYWLCAMAPMVLLGLVQMTYNAMRFGSVFEFGIKYSLTINDFTHVQYHTIYVLALLYNYLLAPVRVTTEYPFINAVFSRLNLNGYFFRDVGNTPGLLFLALPIAAYLLSGKALKKLPATKRREALVLVGLPCVVMPLVTIAAAWSSGYAVRYLADFSWEILMGALLIIFRLYQSCTDRTKKRLAVYCMAISVVWAIVINGVQIYNICYPQDTYPYMVYELERIFAFWK